MMEYLDLISPGSTNRVVWKSGRPERALEASSSRSCWLEGKMVALSAGMIWSVSMLSFKTKQRPWKVVLARVSSEPDPWEAGVARGMAKDAPREEREMEVGRKGVEVVILREGDGKGTKGEGGLLEEEGKARDNVGREDAICVCLDL